MKLGAAAFGVIVTLVILTFPTPAADAQQPVKVYRIGYLGGINPTTSDLTPQGCPTKGNAIWQAYVDGLRERGYVQGQNLVIECRFTEGREERAPALAAELLSLKADLLLVFSTPNVRAAKQATSTIPIVMVGVINPVGAGLVASLARPGGNVTGLSDYAGMETVGKYLQLLKEAVPQVSRVAVLSYSGGQPLPQPFSYGLGEALEAAAPALHVTLQLHEVKDLEDVEGAFAAMKKERAEALLVLSSPFAYVHAQRIVDLAAESRLPAVYPGRDFVDAGGLLAYGVDFPAIRRRVGVYVDKIFKGANPGDLPVEQPTKFELVVNLKTAKALGLPIPQSLLVRADEVIR